MLDLRDRYTRLVAGPFGADRDFSVSLNTAFETIVNANPRTPEYLSIFTDELLRRGQRTLSDEEVDAALGRVVALFRFMSEKDLFARYYKQHLAKRLLSNRSASEDAERSMISKLKVECGFHFTSKFEGMFNDMQLSVDAMAGFQRHVSELPAAARPPIELSVQVLTTGFWPGPGDAAPCALPRELAQCAESFAQFYLATHTGRRLAWQPGMGSVELAARFGTGSPYRISVPTFSACVLVLFNTADELSFADIARATEIEPRELKRTLQTLACAKYRVLTKTPRGKDVNEADTFAFNAAFANKAINFKISNVVVRDNEERRAETLGRVEDDRKLVIEATIVRVMKSRKRLEHNNLVAEVTAQLSARFRPQPQVIKQRIEGLIDREFLDRCDDDRRIYVYKA
jgi:cullin 3